MGSVKMPLLAVALNPPGTAHYHRSPRQQVPSPQASALPHYDRQGHIKSVRMYIGAFSSVRTHPAGPLDLHHTTFPTAATARYFGVPTPQQQDELLH
jgi:hypothetical protein